MTGPRNVGDDVVAGGDDGNLRAAMPGLSVRTPGDSGVKRVILALDRSVLGTYRIPPPGAGRAVAVSPGGKRDAEIRRRGGPGAGRHRLSGRHLSPAHRFAAGGGQSCAE